MASEGAYPRINSSALNVVRALLDNTAREQRDSVSPTHVLSQAEPRTLSFAGEKARPSVRQHSGPPHKHPVHGDSSADPFVGRVIGQRYEITSLLASGGMGKVYRAQQSALGRTVAVKIFMTGYSADPNASKRFFREAAIASKLRHPNTVRIFDYGVTDDNVCYIAMELLGGRTLRQVRREEGTFAPERVIHITRQICRSLAEAHALGVMHRDLKPSNIHLEQHAGEPDFVKVLDFGLVKELGEESEALTKTGLFMGSPHYASPEQIRGKAVDARTDIYSLGVVMHEMLTGHVPFQQEGSFDVLMAHLHEPVPEMDQLIAHRAGPHLQAVVKKCLAKDPNQRYASMDQLHAALAAVESSRSAHATPAAISLRLENEPPARSAKSDSGGAPTWILILLAALFVAGLLFAVPGRIRETPSRAQRSVLTALPQEASGPVTVHAPTSHYNVVVPWQPFTQIHTQDFQNSADELEAWRE